MYLKTDFSQAENICPDIEFIVMFEKRDKPAAINMSIDGKSKDKRTIFADKQAPFRKKPFFTQNIIGNDKNLLIKFLRNTQTEKSDYLAIGVKISNLLKTVYFCYIFMTFSRKKSKKKKNG